MCAARYGHTECVATLLAHGARLDITNIEGVGARDFAVTHQRYAVLALIDSHLAKLRLLEQKRFRAFLLGTHVTVGRGSIVRTLPLDLIELLGKLVIVTSLPAAPPPTTTTIAPPPTLIPTDT
eukprot:c2134_g1_i1.p1 GENE.c2134_g1_i1~~c2134_g1_i1.p1  ORF type:complete len:123 (+),score=31.46 c2134_g1_i1:333-701(+)